MTLVIQRAPEAAGSLIHRFASAQLPLSSQLIVGQEDCVVVQSCGSVLGIVPPGNHWLHPQPFPFLASAVGSGNAVQAELWFVRMTPLSGIKMGGLLGTVLDSGTNIRCTVRGFAEYGIVVADPGRIVSSLLAQSSADAEALFQWTSQQLLKRLGAALVTLVEIEHVRVLANDLGTKLGERVTDLRELEPWGARFQGLGEIRINFAEDDHKALMKVTREQAEAKRAAMVKAIAQASAPAALHCTRCSKAHEAGRFCIECGGPLQ
jgi:membrane protease subunit (stomatin/prohibitin family)